MALLQEVRQEKIRKASGKSTPYFFQKLVTLDFEKLKIKQDWEEKLLNVVAGPVAKVA